MQKHILFRFIFLIIFCLFISIAGGLFLKSLPIPIRVLANSSDTTTQENIYQKHYESSNSIRISNTLSSLEIVSTANDIQSQPQRALSKLSLPLNLFLNDYDYQGNIRAISGPPPPPLPPPPTEIAHLYASDMQEEDQFGWVVSLSNNTLVVGTPWEDGGTGDLALDAGAAYIFERDQGGTDNWGQVKTLHASDMQAGDYFGYAVSISGDTLIVGAYGEDGGTGDPTNDAGAIYIFERNEGGADNWGETKILHASDIQESARFGGAVSISNDTIVVGAHTGNLVSNAGAAYVFERNHGGDNNWGQVKILNASDMRANDYFGISVSIESDTLAVGAYGEDGGTDDPADLAGATYIFARNQGGVDNWGQVKILHASDIQAHDYFGHTVSINGDTLVVGAYQEDGGAGDPNLNTGSAYIFERDQGGINNWGQIKILHASDMQTQDKFGQTASISEDILVIGASAEDGGTGNPAPCAGTAYIFERNQGGTDNWGEVKILRTSDMQAYDYFGHTVSISGGLLAVGAYYEDGGLGDPVSNTGAAYVFRLDESSPTLQTLIPPRNAIAVARDTSIAITYDQPISTATVNNHTFAIHGMQTGLLAQTYNVNNSTIILTPSIPLNPGELVQVSATTGTLSLSGQGALTPTVWQFRSMTLGGSGIFSNSNQSLGSSSSYAVILGDIDGDNDLDAFTGNSDQANTVWLNIDGNGTFIDSGQRLGTGNSLGADLGDIDGDGDLDAFVTNHSGQANKVWLNITGNGIFTDSGQSLGNATSYAVDLGDLDGDGDLDAFVVNLAQPNVIWLNDGTGVFTIGQTLASLDSVAISLGDVDSDGDLDAFIGNASGNPNQVWLNNGVADFVNSGQNMGSAPSFGVALGDLDGDGDLDAFAANDQQPDTVWLNNGTGVFTSSGQSLGNSSSYAVALGDLDGDNDLDAFVGNWQGEGNIVWLNDGSGYFTNSGQNLGSLMSRAVDLGDTDSDGDLDVFVGNENAAGNTVWLNQPRLTLNKSITPNHYVYAPNTNVTYTLNYHNITSNTLSNVTIRDTLAPQLHWLHGGVYSDSIHTINFDLGDLTPQAMGSISYTVQLVRQQPSSTITEMVTNTAIIAISGQVEARSNPVSLEIYGVLVGKPVADYPLDLDITIPGSHHKGEWITFTHSLEPEAKSLHPTKVYSQDGVLLGIGRYFTNFDVERKISMFGKGSDGDVVIEAGETLYVDKIRTALANTVHSGDASLILATTSLFTSNMIGDEIIIIQMQGIDVGQYEFGKLADVNADGNVITLTKKLSNTYTVDSNSKAQVLRVPHYNNFVVYGGPIVRLCRDTNYGGRCDDIYADIPIINSHPLRADTVSSVQLMGGSTVTLYTDDSYLGTSETFTNSDPDLSDNSIGNDKVSSVQVSANCCSTGRVTIHPWDGTTGGVFAIRVSGETIINGIIDVDGLGYAGGPRQPNGQAHGYQGEGVQGFGGQSRYANDGGGGGGPGSVDGGSCGGGGSHATTGSDSTDPFYGDPAFGSATIYGISDLSLLTLGSGGGSGGTDDSGAGNTQYGGMGGNGGGIVFIASSRISGTGRIYAQGLYGEDHAGLPSSEQGGGGGGSGGSIKLLGSNINLDNIQVLALRGNGARGKDCNGGHGGHGRIHIEYCELLSGITTPSAITKQLKYYTIKQLESPPYTTTRLNIPETFSTGRTYRVKYGRRLVFTDTLELLTSLRVPARKADSVTLDALVSDLLTDTFMLKLDVGNDGIWNWQNTQIYTGPTTLAALDLTTAFNAYWTAQGMPTTGNLDIPLRVSLNGVGQVLLTNLYAPAGNNNTGEQLKIAIDGPTVGHISTPHIFTATINPITATLPITYIWKIGNSQPNCISHTAKMTTSDNITIAWPITGTFHITITASNANGTTNDIHTIEVINNLPPSVNHVAIIPTDPTNADNITVSYTYKDPDGDSEDHIRIRWTRNGQLQTAFNDRKVISSSVTFQCENWCVAITPHDGKTYGATVKRCVNIGNCNQPPGALNVMLTPVNPIASTMISPILPTTQGLTVTYKFNDPDGDSENQALTQLRWYRNAKLQPAFNDQPAIALDELHPGEVWYAAVRVHDGTDYGNFAQSTPVVIEDANTGNHIPNIVTATITPTTPEANATLMLTYTFNDPDGDIEGIDTRIRWYRNDMTQPAYNNELTIPATSTLPGDEWYATILPNDGIDYGMLFETNHVQIYESVNNSPPEVMDVHITPAEPGDEDSLSLHYTYSDVDGDPEGNTYILWFTVAMGQIHLEENYIGLTVIPSTTTESGETWFAKVVPHDGETYGVVAAAHSVEVGDKTSNIPPQARNVYLTPEFPSPDEPLELNYEYYDANGDPEAATTITWTVNNGPGGFTDRTIIPAYATAANQTWCAEVAPHDGIEAGKPVTSNCVTVTNTTENGLPEAQTPYIMPVRPSSAQDLTLHYIYFDPDNDASGDTEIHWYCDNELQTDFTGQTSVPANTTQPGEQWHATIRPHDGTDYGTLTTTTAIRINHPPQATNATITPSLSYEQAILAVMYVYSDADNDLESNGEIHWYRNEQHQKLYDNLQQIPAGITTAGEIWYAKVKVHDGIEYATEVTSTMITIQPNPHRHLYLPMILKRHPEQSLTLTRPIGNESWVGGSTQEIIWRTTGNITKISLFYSTDEFMTTIIPITSNSPNTGSYLWSIPNTSIPCAQVRLVDADNPSSVHNTSHCFEIRETLISPAITLTTPIGGENWVMGSQHMIKWEHTGNMPRVNLKYSTDGFATTQDIATAIPNTGYYTWALPPDATTFAQVRIENAQSLTVQDTSGYFIIGCDQYMNWEDNDEQIRACPINFGETYNANPEDIDDWYYIFLDQTASLRITAKNYQAIGQLVVYPYNPDKAPPRDNPLANDGRGLTTMELPNTDLPLALGQPPGRGLPPGRYYIRIYTSGDYNTEHFYQLTTTYQPVEH